MIVNKSPIFDKILSGGAERKICQKKSYNYNWRVTCGKKMKYTFSPSCFPGPLKKEKNVKF